MDNMILILTCVIALLAAFGDTKTFRCDYTYYEDIGGWMKMHHIPETWPEARLRCHLEGGNLASPLNISFGQIMMDMMIQQTDPLKRGVFTGIHSTFSKGDYHSIQNIPLSNIPHKWAKGEPNNMHNKEACIRMLPSGEILDQSCGETYPYICYKKDKNEVVNICGTIDNGYTFDERTGSCYKFHRVPRTWSRAFKTCSAEGGYLAIINSDVEAKVIASIFAKNLPATMIGRFWKDIAFMGFHDWGEHGEFLTIQGQTLNEAGYSKFFVGEPNNHTTGEYCGAVYRNGEYNDLWCENSYAAICEMTPNSLCYDKLKDIELF